jgi:histidinol-phosphate aminotransferase
MAISRRTLFRHLSAGTAAAIGIPSLARAAAVEPLLSGSTDALESSSPVRLHRNENPFGPSPRAVATIRDASTRVTARYPDGTDASLRKALASLHRVYADQVVLGAGSDEVLSMTASAFAAGRTVIAASPTYDRVIERARGSAADVVLVPVRIGGSYDLDAMLSHANAATGLVYICNPNNPTGTVTRRGDLEAFIARLPETTHVVIDEAYHHYVGGSSDYASFLDVPVSDRRVIVTRSFSIAYGLAGLRIGYAIAHPSAAALIQSAGLTNNVSAVAATAAMAALQDTDHVRAAIARNADNRQEFCNQANARMLRTLDSHANFVLLNTGHPAADMVAHFRKHGVLVGGPFAGFDKHIRVSLGTPAEMREFWRVWDLLPPNHVMTMNP